MGGPLSVTMADIHMIRTENEVVKPMKPLFYKRHVDDIYSYSKRNCTDQLYHELNNHHPNTNLTIEINPKKFLDTQVITKMSKQYKQSAINADLRRTKRISGNFDKEIYQMKKAFFGCKLSTKIC